jgi:hypothetical protein
MPTCIPNGTGQNYDIKFKLMVINYKDKQIITKHQESLVLQKPMYKGEGTKTEADKCKLYLKIFQWPKAWIFMRIRKLNC